MNNILQLLENFFDNKLFNIVTFILAVGGIIATIFFFKGKRTKRPKYAIKTNSLVKQNVNKIGCVEILYGGTKVENLSVTKVAFWNDGNDTIKKSDMAPLLPISIKIDDKYEILEASIVFAHNEANNFSIAVAEDKKSLTVDFDYFEHGEGIVIQLFHTATSSENFTVNGKIMSVKKLEQVKSFPLIQLLSPFDSDKYKIPQRYLALFLLLIGFIFVVAPWILPKVDSRWFSTRLDDYMVYTLCGLLGFGYMFIGYKGATNSIPDGYDVFYD